VHGTFASVVAADHNDLCTFAKRLSHMGTQGLEGMDRGVVFITEITSAVEARERGGQVTLNALETTVWLRRLHHNFNLEEEFFYFPVFSTKEFNSNF